MHVRALVIAALVTLAAGLARADEPPSASFHVNDRRLFVGVTFELDLVVDGFEQAPVPEQPKLTVANATVTPIGVKPNLSQRIEIVNGRRRAWTSVQWVFAWQVEISKDGRLEIPATTVVQDGKRATAAAASGNVQSIPTTDQMKLELKLPDRPVFVGENIPITLTWLFRSDLQQNPVFNVPVFGMDGFTIATPSPTKGQRAFKFTGGGKDVELPYKLEDVTSGDGPTHRLEATFYAASRRVGKVELPASSVVASLAAGPTDYFGNASAQLFRAVDVARTLDVKPLPETDRPASFSGAIGANYSLEVRTSRSVVQLGEPIELAVKVRSSERLDTLALGPIDGEGGLPKDKFTVPAEQTTGELSDDGKEKTFKVTAQVIGPATEVPAIAFSYFDPGKGTYQTIHSEPIALAVKGGSIVGANDVVAATPAKGSAARTAASSEADSALVNADLALSSAGDVDQRPLTGALLWLLIGVLYAIPLALLGVRSWQIRTRGQREEAAEVRAARRKVEELLDRAQTAPGRDIAGPLASALRGLAAVLGRTIEDAGVLARLETESFAPGAAASPLSADLRSDTAGLLRRWVADARRTRPGKPTASAVAAVALLLFAPHAHASTLDDGRAAYQEALAVTTNPTQRKAAFARAAAALAEAVRATPDRPELLTDWGNAALGAGDVATATLAYRRALVLDNSNARAQHNLAWLRSRQSDLFRPATSGATDTLLFFHAWPQPHKLLVGAAAFAVAVLLLVPWSGRRRRGLAAVAVLLLAVWGAMIASVVLADRHHADAVVMDDVVLRAADSAGAPATLSQPLPRGVEVTIIERRDSWTRIELASGTSGWVQAGAVEPIAR